MMKRTFFSALVVSVVGLVVQQSLAEIIIISTNGAGVPVNAAQIASGAPSGTVYEFFVDTDGDILSIGNVSIDAPIYNDAFGLDTGESPFVGTPTFERLQVDSWISTPGVNTAILGDGFPASGSSNWSDLSDEGAQAAFQFARLTVPDGFIGTFSGQVTIAGSVGPFSQQFSLPLGIPEPTTMALGLLGLVGVAFGRRRS